MRIGGVGAVVSEVVGIVKGTVPVVVEVAAKNTSRPMNMNQV
jgi:hypothetical protein